MTVTAWLDDEGLVRVDVPLNWGDVMKTIPGARWDDPSRTWQMTPTWQGVQALRGVFGLQLQPHESLAAWVRQLWDSRIGPLTTLRSMDELELPGPTAARLWPLQRVACYGMAFAERYGVLDEMGGGKTRTTLAAMKLSVAWHGAEEVFPALVVCPNKVRRTWVQEAHDDRDGLGSFWPELRIEVLPKGKPAQRKLLQRVKDGEVDVVAANWEAIAGLSRLEPFGNIEMTDKEKAPGPLNEIGWRTVVLDEAHRAANRKSKQTRAAKAIAFGTAATGTGPTRFRWELTGTPINTNSAEAWSLLNLLDPVAWPAYSKFVERYATSVWNQYGGLEIGGIKPETREEFYRCTDPITIRRLRSQFDPFKPDVIEQTYSVPMETKQASAYKAMASDMLAELEGGILVSTSALTRSSRLAQLAQAYGEMVDKGRRDPEGQTIMDLQLAMPSNKVKAMLELVEEAGIQPGGGSAGLPLVFGAASRQLIGLCEEALKKAKIPYALVAGGMSDDEQNQHEDRFKRGEAKVALCVIDAAKEGLNWLTSAAKLVVLQRSWSRTANVQFLGRIDRPGQKAEKIEVIYVVSEGTIEEWEMLENLAAKDRNFEEVVADERALEAMLRWKGRADA